MHGENLKLTENQICNLKCSFCCPVCCSFNCFCGGGRTTRPHPNSFN